MNLDNISFQNLHGEKSSFIAPQDGKKVGFIGKIIAIWNTIKDLITGIRNHADVMGNHGLQLKSGQLIAYLNYLETKGLCYFATYGIYDFTGAQSEVDAITTRMDVFYADPQERKLAIPLILPPLSFFEEKHMVMIFIDKDAHTMDYFDAKGITSDNRQLVSGGNMRQNVIHPISRKMLAKNQDAIQINENARIIQWDCHHCGAYVSWFAKQRLKEAAAQIIQGGIDLPGIHEFRKEMKTMKSSVTPYSGPPVMAIGEGEFE